MIETIQSRLDREALPSDAELLRTATFVLLGLKHPRAFVEKIMSRNVLELSSTYQGLLQEGRAEGKIEEARNLLIRLCTKRFGAPDAAIRVALDAADLPRLEEMADRLLEAESWQELLAGRLPVPSG